MNNFKSFFDSFNLHFGIDKASEPNSAVFGLLFQNPRHIVILNFEGLDNSAIDSTLTPWEFLKKGELFDFEDLPSEPFKENFSKIKTFFNNRQNTKFEVLETTLTENHNDFLEFINKIKHESSSKKEETFIIATIKVSAEENNAETYRLIDDSLIPFKESLKDNLLFVISQDSEKARLIFSQSNKSEKDKEPIPYPSIKDTGKVGWVVFFSLVGFIFLCLVLKIY